VHFASIPMIIAACAAAMPVSAGTFEVTSEIGLAAEVVGDDLVPSEDTNRTFRLWAVTPENWRIEAVVGNTEVGMRFEVTGGAFYQNEFGGPTSQQINEGFFSLVPELEWDSYLTIGALSSNSNDLNDIGIDWSSFDESGTLLEADNGTVFVTFEHSQGDATTFTDGCGRSGHGVVIAQFTLVGEGASLEGSLLLQGRNDLNVTVQAHIPSFTIDADGISDALPDGACAADITGDDQVDVHDLLHLLGNWYEGACEDITRDLLVDSDDVLHLINSWGACSAG